jgi:predicted small secreted protein
MKSVLAVAMLAMASLPLAACGGNGDDKLAGQVKDAADNRADQMEAAADNLKEQAEQTRKVGEKRADAIDAADVNAQAMTPEHKAEIIANDAAAVR